MSQDYSWTLAGRMAARDAAALGSPSGAGFIVAVAGPRRSVHRPPSSGRSLADRCIGRFFRPSLADRCRGRFPAGTRRSVHGSYPIENELCTDRRGSSRAKTSAALIGEAPARRKRALHRSARLQPGENVHRTDRRGVRPEVRLVDDLRAERAHLIEALLTQAVGHQDSHLGGPSITLRGLRAVAPNANPPSFGKLRLLPLF